MRKKLALLIFVLLVCSLSSPSQSNSRAEFLGRYTDGADYVVYFEETRFGMTLRPALWTATQLLQQTGTDEFIVTDRTERGATFQRDARGQVTGVKIRGMEGEGLDLTKANHPLLAIELLLRGRGRESAREYMKSNDRDPTKVLTAAERVFNRFPSKVSAVVEFLSTLVPRYPSNSKLYTMLAYAYVAQGDRPAALKSFRRAYQLEPTNREAVSGLARLAALPKSEGVKDKPWKVPFPLAAVFESPTPEEIREVVADWRARDLNVRKVVEVATGRIRYGNEEMQVRIVSHLVNGQKHFGAIISPLDAKPSCCPVIVEAKGVSWNYFPLNLERLDAPRFMGEARKQFIYVVPSFRGEVMHFAGVDYQSEGDRTNAWDGATDDAIALLNVALETTPAADASRVGVFGRSRGGTVALLMGERDSRIRCVVEWSGPSDWLSLMGTEGWTQKELFAEGLRTRAAPDKTGGQLVEHFLSRAHRGEETLRAVRQRLLASSPLYFTNRLPRVQLHYGMEDTSVPVRNGIELARRLNLHFSPSTNRRAMRGPSKRRTGSEAFCYPGQGHDTDRLLAPEYSRQFLIDVLLRNH